MIKAALFLLLALFVDGFVAAVCLIVFIVSAFPLTLLGAAAGCAAGANTASWMGVSASVGCQIGGAVGGIAGSIPGAQQAVTFFTLPVGAALGFGISIVLNIVLGGLLLGALYFGGILKLQYVFCGGVKIIPGLNIFPWYTTIVILCLVADAKGKRTVDEFVDTSMKEYRESRPLPVQGPPTRNGAPPQERAPRYAPQRAPSMQDVRVSPKETYRPEPAPVLQRNAA